MCIRDREKPHNFSAGRTVKVAGRFVRQNDGWVRSYGARNSSALLLAAGELACKVMHAFDKANFCLLYTSKNIDEPFGLKKRGLSIHEKNRIYRNWYYGTGNGGELSEGRF